MTAKVSVMVDAGLKLSVLLVMLLTCHPQRHRLPTHSCGVYAERCQYNGMLLVVLVGDNVISLQVGGNGT